jgi:hypothetical protein
VAVGRARWSSSLSDSMIHWLEQWWAHFFSKLI